MEGVWLLLLGAGLLAAAFLVVRAVRAWLRYRGVRLVRCPETAEYASVRVDAGHAAATGAGGGPDLRLETCSRWPERAGCGQECLSQVRESPHDCLLRNMVTGWYAGKSCVYCGRDLGEFRWPDYRCALRTQNGQIAEWHDVIPEKLPALMARAQPVCWVCLVAEDFRRQHPDLVTDRPGPPSV